MPSAVFEDEDLIEAIANATGYRPKIILKKIITKDGKIEVFWR